VRPPAHRPPPAPGRIPPWDSPGSKALSPPAR
jgi:hypothetical protein